jgi:hypothetical protein
VLRHEDRRLEHRAHRVANARGWNVTYPEVSMHWLSDREVLAMHTPKWTRNRPTAATSTPGSRYADITSGGDFFIHDIETGRSKPLPEVTRAYHLHWSDPHHISVSRDGKTIVWRDVGRGGEVFFGGGERYPGYGISIDGKSSLRWSSDGPIEPMWLPDNHTWIDFVYRVQGAGISGVTLHTVEQSSKSAFIPIPVGSPFYSNKKVWYVSGISANGNLIMDAFDNAFMSTPCLGTDIMELRLSDMKQVIRLQHIDLPPDARLDHRAYSPQGDRVAWLLRMDRSPRFGWIFGPLRHRLGMDAKLVESIWVCGVDGTGSHEVCFQQAADPMGDNSISDLQWLPGGKTLSFRCRDALWTVPAD